MKKTTFSHIFCAGLLMMFAGAGSARATSVLFLNPNTVNTTVGSTFAVAVQLFSDSVDVSAFDMAVTFPTNLTAVSVIETGYFAGQGVLGLNPTIDNVGGTITGILDLASSPDTLLGQPTFPGGPTIPGTDTLFAIVFQANAIGSGALTLECDNGNDCADSPMFADGSFNSIPVDSINNGTITVSSPEPSSGWLAVPLLGAAFLLRKKARSRLTARP